MGYRLDLPVIGAPAAATESKIRPLTAAVALLH
jgi:hypothetical protein